MKFIIGQKVGMKQVFMPDGNVVPVTVVKAGPCQVTQVKSDRHSVQVGFGAAKEFRLNKPDSGHLKGLNPVSHLHDFTVAKIDGINRGDVIALDTFSAGDTIEVTGTSKGKGFAGVVKRHHFRGGPASHGHKDNLRMPGSIGAGGVQRVFKGMRMGGRMGGDQVTVKNLQVVEVHAEAGELYIKGAVPGGRNGILLIRGEGELKIAKPETPVEAVVEAPMAEVAADTKVSE
jgi:large subunit ribosomal protein L3